MLSASGTVRNPPNPDIQGRHASDFCIKRCYNFRGFEPDADLVIFASCALKTGCAFKGKRMTIGTAG